MDFAVPAVLIIDLEINPKTDTVFKIGAYRPDLDLGFERSFHHEEGFRKALAKMLPLAEGAEWLMGHNFLEHDLPYLKKAAPDQAWLSLPVIDTLKLSPLAFPQNPYHRLIKNYKIISSELNSPLTAALVGSFFKTSVPHSAKSKPKDPMNLPYGRHCPICFCRIVLQTASPSPNVPNTRTPTD